MRMSKVYDSSTANSSRPDRGGFSSLMVVVAGAASTEETGALIGSKAKTNVNTIKSLFIVDLLVVDKVRPPSSCTKKLSAFDVRCKKIQATPPYKQPPFLQGLTRLIQI